jgi:hypothetical protein
VQDARVGFNIQGAEETKTFTMPKHTGKNNAFEIINETLQNP